MSEERRPFQRSDITDGLVRYLQQHDKGTRIAYGELSKLVSHPIDARTPYLRVARMILERDYNQVWLALRGEAQLQRLNDPEIAARQATWWLLGARNKLSNGAKQADVVEIEALTIDQQARFATDSIVRELARDALSKATTRRIQKVARGSSNDLPSFNAVEWMISLSPKRSRT
jgi:hypothetical protein